MVFSSFEFILYFLPVFLIIYFLTPAAWKNVVIFLGSLVFYYYGVKDRPAYVFLMLLSVVVNYYTARRMDRCRHTRERKKWLMLGMNYNIGCLFVLSIWIFCVRI